MNSIVCLEMITPNWDHREQAQSDGGGNGHSSSMIGVSSGSDNSVWASAAARHLANVLLAEKNLDHE